MVSIWHELIVYPSVDSGQLVLVLEGVLLTMACDTSDTCISQGSYRRCRTKWIWPLALSRLSESLPVPGQSLPETPQHARRAAEEGQGQGQAVPSRQALTW